MFGERGGDFNCNTKEKHSNSLKNPQPAGHAHERNYLGVVVYSALQKRYFLPDFPIIAEKVFGRVGEAISKVFNQKTHKKNVGAFQFKMQVKKNITKYVALCNIPRNM
jgi:hypothetical protein